MDLNDLMAAAQNGAHSPRKSKHIRKCSWLTINEEKIPICDMSDKNLLGSIKGIFSTLPTKFLMEWGDTVGRAAGVQFTEDQRLDTYHNWLAHNWFKYIPDAVITMAEEAEDRDLPFDIGEGEYATKTAEFLRSILVDKMAEAKTETQISTK